MPIRRTAVPAILLAVSACAQEAWKMPELRLPEPLPHPLVAATPVEFERLRAAWKSTGRARDVLAHLVAGVDKTLQEKLVFPERGGQHNQWYQCDACQRALNTVDATHHRCAGCNKVYSGEPYDDVIFARVHTANLKNARQAAWAYTITGEEKYAAFAAQVLAGYAERYAKYPYHDNGAGRKPPGKTGGHLFEQTLNEAYHLATDIGPAFDLIFPALDEAQRNAIRAGLIKLMLENIARHKAGKSNWQTWHNAGFIWGGACLDDVEWIKRALEAEGNGFVSQMKESVTADGMWYENSWGYHFYTLHALVAMAEGSRRLGVDLWSHPAFKNMFTLAAEYTMADGSLPRFGDDVNSSAASAQGPLAAAYHAYRDPAILALLSPELDFQGTLLGRDAAQRAAAPELRSRVFDAAGHAILRAKGPAGLTAAFSFSPFGGFHGHFDKLSFVFFGHGVELGVDPGRAKSQAYRLPVHGRWYRATIGHNAVVVNRQSQAGVAGALELFGANEQFAAVRARCDAAYPGIGHARTLVLTPEYLLVVDDLDATDKTGKKEHRFDWLYHHKGQTVACAAATEDAELKDYPGAEFIKRQKSGTSDAAVRVKFEGAGIDTWLTLDAQPGTGVLTGDGAGSSMEDRVPLAMVTRQGQAARFAAVLEPVKVGAEATVASVAIEEKDGAVTVTVRRGAASDTIGIAARRIEVRRGTEQVLEAKAAQP